MVEFEYQLYPRGHAGKLGQHQPEKMPILDSGKREKDAIVMTRQNKAVVPVFKIILAQDNDH